MADDDIIRGGLDIVTDKTKKKKPKANQETAQPTAARFKKPKADQETAQPTAARFKKKKNKPKAEQETAQPTAARFNNFMWYIVIEIRFNSFCAYLQQPNLKLDVDVDVDECSSNVPSLSKSVHRLSIYICIH